MRTLARQIGQTLVGPRPLRLRADQPHAGAAGVVMHFPLGREKHFYVFRREEIRCTVRAVQHGDLPVIGIVRQKRRRQARARVR